MNRGRRGRRAGEHTEPPILILGLDGLSMAHGALAAVRSAGRLGVAAFLAYGGGRSPIETSRYAAGTVALPSEAPLEAKLEPLLAFGRGHEKPVLLPVDDLSTLFVEEHAAELDPVFRFPRQPERLASSLTDKRAMYELCLRAGVATPRSAFPRSEAELDEYALEAQFPVVLKRIRPPYDPAAPRVCVVRDRAALLATHRLMAGPDSPEPEVMLQEYIPDLEQSNWIFNGYFDAQSRCLVAFTGRKLRQAPPGGGAATLGVCEANEAIEATTVSFLEDLGYRGLVDVDYRLDHRDGQYKLLDVNARIGASFRLFVADDGTDVLRAMYMDMIGTPIEAVAQPDGRRWLVEPQDLRFALTYLRDGSTTLRAWARSLREADEYAWWARDDPLPALTLFARLLTDRARRLWMPNGGRAAGEATL